jgi:hypothetical protein
MVNALPGAARLNANRCWLQGKPQEGDAAVLVASPAEWIKLPSIRGDIV